MPSPSSLRHRVRGGLSRDRIEARLGYRPSVETALPTRLGWRDLGVAAAVCVAASAPALAPHLPSEIRTALAPPATEAPMLTAARAVPAPTPDWATTMMDAQRPGATRFLVASGAPAPVPASERPGVAGQPVANAQRTAATIDDSAFEIVTGVLTEPQGAPTPGAQSFPTASIRRDLPGLQAMPQAMPESIPMFAPGVDPFGPVELGQNPTTLEDLGAIDVGAAGAARGVYAPPNVAMLGGAADPIDAMLETLDSFPADAPFPEAIETGSTPPAPAPLDGPARLAVRGLVGGGLALEGFSEAAANATSALLAFSGATPTPLGEPIGARDLPEDGLEAGARRARALTIAGSADDLAAEMEADFAAVAPLDGDAPLTAPAPSPSPTAVDALAALEDTLPEAVIPAPSREAPPMFALRPTPDPRNQALAFSTRLRGDAADLPTGDIPDAPVETAIAAPVPPAAPRPAVSLVLTAVGLNTGASDALFDLLPSEVAVAIAPIAADSVGWASRAQEAGRVVFAETPLEPTSYPRVNPGPLTLLTSSSVDENMARLGETLGRVPGADGVATYLGGAFSQDDTAVATLIASLQRRGMMVLETAPEPGKKLTLAAAAAGLTAFDAAVSIDRSGHAEDVREGLAKLEAAARRDGYAIGVGVAIPSTVSGVAAWAAELDARGFDLEPLAPLPAPAPAIAAVAPAEDPSPVDAE